MEDVVADNRTEAKRLANRAMLFANNSIVNGKTADANSMRQIIADLANAILNLAR